MKGLSWGAAAIGNATWSGARLTDVLKAAGLKDDQPGIEHIQVSCDQACHIPQVNASILMTWHIVTVLQKLIDLGYPPFFFRYLSSIGMGSDLDV